MKNISKAPDLRQLRYFVAVAESLHFGRAAARLGIQQPPLSQQIQQLERSVGAPLFHRSRRHVELADAGRALLPEARRLLAEAEQMLERARRAGRGEIGQLTVAFTGTCALSPVLGRAVREFRARHPGVALSLVGLHSAEQVEALRAGRIDLGLLRPPIPDPGERCTLYALPDERVVAAIPDGHAALASPQLRLGDLRNEDFLLFPRPVGPGLYDRLMQLCRSAGFEPRIVQEAPEFTSIIGLVAAGLGVALVPASMQAVQLQGLHYRPLADAAADVALALVAPRSPSPGVVYEFMQFVLRSGAD